MTSLGPEDRSVRSDADAEPAGRLVTGPSSGPENDWLGYLAGRVSQIFDAQNPKRPRWTLTDARGVRALIVDCWEANRVADAAWKEAERYLQLSLLSEALREALRPFTSELRAGGTIASAIESMEGRDWDALAAALGVADASTEASMASATPSAELQANSTDPHTCGDSA